MKTTMAGIGPIFSNRNELRKRAGFRSNLTAPKNELEIFCSLCVGRVYLDKRSHYLYYVDSPALDISEIVRRVFQGLEQEAEIEQLYMDEHQVIAAALRIHLTPKQRKSLLVALKLNGVHIDGE